MNTKWITKSKPSPQLYHIVMMLLLLSNLLFPSAFAISGESEALEIKELMNRVNELCPPEDCFLIAIGRSGTPVMALRQALFPDSGRTVPLSQFRLSADGALDLESSPIWKDLEEEAFKRFRNHLPSAEEIGERRAMIVDYTQTGFSLFSAYHAIKRYYETLNTRIELETIALLKKAHREYITKMAQSFQTPIHFAHLKRTPIVQQKLIDQKYDAVAEFGFAPLREPDDVYESRPEYFEFQERLARYAAPELFRNDRNESGMTKSGIKKLCQSFFLSLLPQL